MKKHLLKLIEGETLSREDTHSLMLGIAQGSYPQEQVAALLMALQTRGATVDELLGFRDGLLQSGKSIDLGDEPVLDIVGTGGDGKNTFNISTCAAFTVAGAGVSVAKHGNFASTSVSGASNLLASLGAKFTSDEATLRLSLRRAGICYLHAPLFATVMKAVAPVRKALAVPTCFNQLGPLVNPCQPTASLHGTATLAQLRLYANVHQRIGDRYAIVTSQDGYDEVSLTAPFKIAWRDREEALTPQDIGLATVSPEEIHGGASADEAKKLFLSVLEGTSTQGQRDVVVANAAVALTLALPGKSLSDCIAAARESLESGKALVALKRFLEVNA